MEFANIPRELAHLALALTVTLQIKIQPIKIRPIKILPIQTHPILTTAQQIMVVIVTATPQIPIRCLHFNIL